MALSTRIFGKKITAGKHALHALVGATTGKNTGFAGATEGWLKGVNEDAQSDARNKPIDVNVTVNRTKQQNTTDVNSFDVDNDNAV